MFLLLKGLGIFRRSSGASGAAPVFSSFSTRMAARFAFAFAFGGPEAYKDW
jgi:hypothetical protein